MTKKSITAISTEWQKVRRSLQTGPTRKYDPELILYFYDRDESGEIVVKFRSPKRFYVDDIFYQHPYSVDYGDGQAIEAAQYCRLMAELVDDVGCTCEDGGSYCSTSLHPGIDMREGYGPYDPDRSDCR